MRRIRPYTICLVAICVGSILLSAAKPARADEVSARTKLAEKGIRATRSGISLQADPDFSRSLATAFSLKRKVVATINQQQSAGYDNEEADAQVQTLSQQNELLKKQYSQINSSYFPIRHEIAEKIKTNDSEIALIQETRKQAIKSFDELRKNANSASEKYVQQVLAARTMADRILAQYADLKKDKKDKEVVAALNEWNEAVGTSNELKPTHGFESALKRLEALEKQIVSEKIPLRHEGKS
jgi:hypothetical protein